MKVFLCLLLVFSCFAIPPVKAQRLITLRSGQEITLNNDGSYRKTIDTPIIVEYNKDTSIEVKDDPEYLLKKAANLVLSKAESKEIDQFVLTEMLDKELSARQLLVSQSIALNNKQAEANANKEVDDIKDKIKILTKLYHNASLKVIECRNLLTNSKGINVKQLKALATEFDVDIKPYIKKELKTKESKNQPNSDKTSVEINANLISAKDQNCRLINHEDKSISLEYDHFYNFTPEILKFHFKGNDLMNTLVSLKKINKTYFLQFKIDITSKQAAKNYGVIYNASLLKINFINGKSLNLSAESNVVGHIEAYSGHFIYEVQYKLDKEAIKSLQKYPIDSLGIMWSSGFELYDIYNVDLIINQLNCIKS